jgi:hypothetical protein
MKVNEKDLEELGEILLKYFHVRFLDLSKNKFMKIPNLETMTNL